MACRHYSSFPSPQSLYFFFQGPFFGWCNMSLKLSKGHVLQETGHESDGFLNVKLHWFPTVSFPWSWSIGHVSNGCFEFRVLSKKMAISISGPILGNVQTYMTYNDSKPRISRMSCGSSEPAKEPRSSIHLPQRRVSRCHMIVFVTIMAL